MTSVAEVITRRGINEVLHFTTNTGFVGMLAVGLLLPRARLPKEKYLEHIYRPNVSYRKDPAWLDYVSLSITRINTQFFGASSRWHFREDVWWCVVSVDSTILNHPGVTFTTTNNIYSGNARAQGGEGLEVMFAPETARWEGCVVLRPPDTSENEPTCEQAEVLYPGGISTKYLQAVYVATELHADIVGAQLDLLFSADPGGLTVPPIKIRPDVFEARR